MAAPGRGSWAAPTGPAKGGAARRGCPASPSPASSRRSPSAGPKVWLGSSAELGRPGLRAVQQLLPGHRPGVRPRTQLSRRGLPSSGGVRAHTHTHTYTHARPRPRFRSAALAVAQSRSLPPGARPPQAPPGGEAGGRTRAGAGRGEGPALGECLAAPAPRVSDWARRSPPSVPLPPSRSPPSLARRQPRLAPCPLPGGTFRAAAAASFTL